MTDKNKRSKYLRFPGRLLLVKAWIILLTLCSFHQSLSAQIDTNTVISGIINTYTKILNTYSQGTDSVKIADTTGFHVNDAVMIVQMKIPSFTRDPSILDGESSLNHKLLSCGQYEIVKIKEIRSIDSVIVFTTQLTYYPDGLYNTAGFVQLIRVPIYKNVTVGPPGLSCLPWDKSRGTGGILVFFAINQLNIEGDINVSGKGFHGADPGTESYTGICSNDSAIYTNINYPGTSMNRAGYKGEGVAVDDTAKLKGRGYRLSNPGGGNGRFSGGGGGSSYGAGGTGGFQQCFGNSIGGVGGESLATPIGLNHIFLGSGGGAGTQLLPTINASKGGNGGGIVIIVAPNINSFKGKGIYADGMHADSFARAGGGGGGGAGMILIDIENCSGALKLEAVGGQGGNTTKFGTIIGGPGGGGGGGLVWYRSSSNFIFNTNGGDLGKNLPSGNIYSENSGGPGFGQSGVIIQNKGFLFNYLPADDTICKAALPKKIIGSVPRGGDGVYNYIWLRSEDDFNWSDTVSNGSLKDCQPPLVDTSLSVIYYKRVVRSGYNISTDSYAFADESAPYAIHLYPPILNNTISSPDSVLCNGTVPNLMTGSFPAGGTGKYKFYWEVSSKISDWSKADTLGKLQSFTPVQKLTAKTKDSLYYFRRSITSGGCTNNQNSIILKILPQIKGNHIVPNQILCNNIIPIKLQSDSDLFGGDKKYRKTWEISANGGATWSAVDTSLIYQSPGLQTTKLVRRIVKSGPGDVCQNTSKTDTLTVRPSLSNNKLTSTDTTICAGFAPNPFRGLKPSGGDTVLHYYQYSWLISTDNSHWSEIYRSHGDTTGYASDPLNATSWFKRKVVSGVEAACRDSNNLIKITVHPRIANNLIASLDTICKGQIPSKPFTTGDSIIGGNQTYPYKWQESFNKLKPSQWVSPLGRPANQYNLAPDTLDFDRYYRRIVFSGACFDTTQNPLFIKVLQPIGNNSVLISDTIVCKGTSPKAMFINGSPTDGNGLYNFSWQRGADSSSLVIVNGETSPYYSPGNIDTLTFIRRKIISGPCQSLTKALTLKTHQIPVGYLTGPVDTSICDNGRLMNIKIRMTNGKAPWDVYLTNSFKIQNISSNDALTEITFSSVNQEKQIFTFTIDSLIDANKCYALSKSGQVISTVYSLPVSSSVPLNDTVCGNQAVLKGSKPGYAIGTWLVGSLNVSVPDLHNPAAVITNNRLSESVQLDSVYVIWNVYNWDSTCSINRYSKMFFYSKPVASIQEPSFKRWIGRKDSTIFNHDTGILRADSIIYPNTGMWTYATTGTPVQFSPVDRPTTQVQGLLNNDTPGTWTIFWTVQNPGCPSVVDTAYVASSRIHAYKGFSPGYGLKTPDGKPLDEVYWIEGIEYESDFKLTVLSSWNKVVYMYHGSGLQWTGWNGKGNQIDNNGKEMPEGTYYYILEVKDQKYTGPILLRRKN
jgi:hypothetical protein